MENKYVTKNEESVFNHTNALIEDLKRVKAIFQNEGTVLTLFEKEVLSSRLLEVKLQTIELEKMVKRNIQ